MTEIINSEDKPKNGLNQNLSLNKNDVLSSLDDKIVDIVEDYSNGRLDLKDLLDNKDVISNIKLGKTQEWMNFEDQEKVKLFNNSIEKNDKFVDLVNYLKSEYIDENGNNKKFFVDSVEENVKTRLSELSYKDRYIAMIYIALNYGIYINKIEKYNLGNIVEYNTFVDILNSITDDSNGRFSAWKRIRDFLNECKEVYEKGDYNDESEIFEYVVDKYYDISGRIYKDGSRTILDIELPYSSILDKYFEKFRINGSSIRESKIVETFDLDTTSRDGETAVNDPYELEEHNFKNTSGWDLKFKKAVDKFLLENDKNTKDLVKKAYGKYSSVLDLKQLINYYKEISKIKENFSINDNELLKLLDISDLTDLEQLQDKKEIINFLKSKKESGESTVLKRDLGDIGILSVIENSGVSGDVKIETPKNPNHINTSKDSFAYTLGKSARQYNKSKAEKIYYNTLVFISGGEIKYINLEPYFIYQDFEGGNSTKISENEIVSLSDYKVSGETLELFYNDGKKLAIKL